MKVGKLSHFFGVTPDYLLGYDIQSKLDKLSMQISQLKKEILTASGERKNDLENTLFVLTESYDDLLFAQAMDSVAGENKKSLSEESLTEREAEFIMLFRQVPDDHKETVMQMIRVYIQTISVGAK